jgi:hypothetical protein
MRHNTIHYDHAADLARRLNAEGWRDIDEYSEECLRKSGRFVIVSCPECEDDLTIWHMFQIRRNRAGHYAVEPYT